jgi:aspartate/methionine/tyrosine aminotransferase
VRIEPFRMERMQSRFENYVEYNLSESGVHPLSIEELLEDRDDRERLLRRELGYTQSNGSEELRDRIALFYEGAARENVLVTNGGSEANFVTLWSRLESRDRVAYMLPNYLQTWGLSRAFAAKADPFRLVQRRDGGRRRWALDVEGLRRAVTKRTRLIMVTNPNNPTGGVLTEEEMDEIIRCARRVGAWIVADEIYRGAEVSGRTSPTFWGRYDKLVVTSGLSKAFGLPGLRIGWVVGPAKIVERIWSYRDYTSIAPGMISDHVACLVMEPKRREAILERSRSIIQRNLAVVENWLASHADILTCTPPLAGAIAFARYDLPIASVQLSEKLRLERSVLIVPGDLCGTGKHIRIGFGSKPDYLERGLDRISLTLRELRRSSGRRITSGGASRRMRPARRGRTATILSY